MLQQVENELFAVATADEIHFRALLLHQRGVEAGKHAAERQLHLLLAARISRARILAYG